MRNPLPLPFRTSMSFMLILVVLFLSACSGRPDESQTTPANTGQNGTPSAGESKEMSQEEWDNLVEYVACYYAWAYYDKMHGAFLVEGSKPTDLYQHLDIDSLHASINNCKGDGVHKKNCNILIDSINAKKKSEDRTLENLIQLPDTKPEEVGNSQNYPQWLENFTNQLKEDTILIQSFSSKSIRQKNLRKRANDGKKKEDRTVETADTEQAIEKDEKRGGNSLWWLFLLLGAAAGVGGVMAWRKWATPFFNPQQESAPRKRQEPSLQHDEYKKMQLQLEKYKEDNLQLESKNRRLEQEKRELAQQNKSLFRENIGLGDEIETLKAKNEHEVQEDFPEDDQPAISSPRPSPAPEPISHPTSSPAIFYAASIIDNTLMGISEEPTDDTVFKLTMTESDTATITIFPDAVQRIIANPAFLEGCDKQVLTNATAVTVEETGTAQKRADNGKWEVRKKLKVIIQ